MPKIVRNAVFTDGKSPCGMHHAIQKLVNYNSNHLRAQFHKFHHKSNPKSYKSKFFGLGGLGGYQKNKVFFQGGCRSTDPATSWTCRTSRATAVAAPTRHEGILRPPPPAKSYHQLYQAWLSMLALQIKCHLYLEP